MSFAKAMRAKHVFYTSLRGTKQSQKGRSSYAKRICKSGIASYLAIV